MNARLKNSKKKLTASPERGGAEWSEAEGSDPSVTSMACQLPFQGSRIEKVLKKSPINYFSDLFIIAMVVCWILVLVAMCIMAVYATVHYADVTI